MAQLELEDDYVRLLFPLMLSNYTISSLCKDNLLVEMLIFFHITPARINRLCFTIFELEIVLGLVTTENKMQA